MIKRFFASKDNTISNAFKEDLVTRATGSNMGASDVLEVFTIYGQADSGSVELTRFLVEFPIDEVSAARTSGNIPASGSVSFYLKMFNAAHSQPVPRNYTLDVLAVSRAWEEGYGLDMENYEDLTYDGIGSNWINAAGGTTWTTPGGDFHATPAFTASFETGLEDIELDVSTIVEEWIAGSGGGGKDNYGFGIKFTSAFESEEKSFYTKRFFARDSQFHFYKPVLEARWNSVREDDRGTFYASSSLASATDNLNTLYLYNRIRGRLRDIPVAPTSASLRSSATGANLYSADVSRDSTGIYKADLFLETTASTLYDVWTSGSKASTILTFGSGVPSNGALEMTFGEVGTFTLTFDNTTGSSDSDIGSDAAATIDPSVEVDSAGNAQKVLLLLRDGVTGDGIKNSYNFVYDGSSPGAETVTITSKEEGPEHNITVTESLDNLSSTTTDGSMTAYYTGSISVKSFYGYGYNPEETYFLSMPGLRKEYRKNQTHRLNLYVREKDWSPNIYTTAIRNPIPPTIVQSASYQLRRSIDDYVVVPYGTGSTLHTALSYDVSGNYFDLHTTYLESGYLYEVQYSFYDEENGWEEQPYRFKFRVVD